MDEPNAKPFLTSSPLVHLWVFLFLFLTVFTVYGQVADFSFISLDDDIFVKKNEKVLQGINKDTISWAFSIQDQETYWHPLTWLAHMLDVELFGTAAGRHHVSNVVIHLLAAFLLYLFLFISTGTLWRSFFVAVVFALHPLNVESVVWISERKNTLSTFFLFLTMLCYAHYAKKQLLLSYLLALAAFSAGLLSKPMLITLPFVLFLLDYWPLKRFRTGGAGGETSRKRLKFKDIQTKRVKLLVAEKIPFLFLALLVAFFVLHSLDKVAMKIPLENVPFSARLSNAIVSYFYYIGKVFCPINLAVFYPFPDSISVWLTIFASTWIVCITILFIYKSPQRPYLFTGWFWFLGTLVPVIGLIQAGLWPAMADRWAYVPMVGLLIVAIWGGTDLLRHRKIKVTWIIIFSTALITVLIGVSRKQTSYWRNSVKLFGHALDIGIRHPIIHLNLGAGYAEMNRSKEAIEQYHLALQGFEYTPRYKGSLKKLYNKLGIEMAKTNNPEASASYFLKALNIDPDSYDNYINVANVFFEQKMHPQAINAYREALKLRPDSVPALNNLGLIYAAQEQYDTAVSLYQKAITHDKNHRRSYNNLGIALCAKGEVDAAVKNFQKALALDPSYKKARKNLNRALSGRCISPETDTAR